MIGALRERVTVQNDCAHRLTTISGTPAAAAYQPVRKKTNYAAGLATGVYIPTRKNGQSLVGKYTAADTTTTFLSLLNPGGGATITVPSTPSFSRYDSPFRLTPPVSSRIT